MKISNKYLCLLSLLLVVTVASGCASKTASPGSGRGRKSHLSALSESADRMLIRQASLGLKVNDIHDATEDAVDIVKQHGGYVENENTRGEKYADLTLRVPSKDLTAVMDALSELGKETFRRMSSEDVTEEFIDIEARLKNAKALRDRLRRLLDQAQNVSDILSIERELTRVQSEIDSMEGRLKALKGRADFAAIHFSLERKTILGPLGYLTTGIGWCIKKLFIIR